MANVAWLFCNLHYIGQLLKNNWWKGKTKRLESKAFRGFCASELNKWTFDFEGFRTVPAVWLVLDFNCVSVW